MLDKIFFEAEAEPSACLVVEWESNTVGYRLLRVSEEMKPHLDEAVELIEEAYESLDTSDYEVVANDEIEDHDYAREIQFDEGHIWE